MYLCPFDTCANQTKVSPIDLRAEIKIMSIFLTHVQTKPRLPLSTLGQTIHISIFLTYVQTIPMSIYLNQLHTKPSLPLSTLVQTIAMSIRLNNVQTKPRFTLWTHIHTIPQSTFLIHVQTKPRFTYWFTCLCLSFWLICKSNLGLTFWFLWTESNVRDIYVPKNCVAG